MKPVGLMALLLVTAPGTAWDPSAPTETWEQTFVHDEPLWISDALTEYPSLLDVSGMPGIIQSIRVDLIGLWHQYPDDIDMLLVGPQGQAVMVMSDVGGECEVVDVDLAFGAGKVPLPDGCRLSSGEYSCTDMEPGDVFPAPAPPGPYITDLGIFESTNPNGQWSLFVFDDYWGLYGELDAWSLTITTIEPDQKELPLREPAIGVEHGPVLVSADRAASTSG